MKEMSYRTPQKVGLLACGFLCSSVILTAGENSISDSAEISTLKAQLASQQEQIDQLRKELQAQKILILQSRQGARNASGSTLDAPSPPVPEAEQIASLSPAFPTSGATVPEASKEIHSALPDSEIKPSPLSIGIGSAQITPVGFLDLTAIYRSKNVGSGLGTNFGAIPFNNSVDGNLSETRLSAQNSRLGARLDTKVLGVNVLGYLETDFLGYTPGNAAVTSHSDGLRLRLYWVKLRKSKFEILAGQSWSMLTPNRKGISPLPADLFLTQDIDPNIQVGLTWARSPQLRFMYHPKETVSLGLSVEASEQYAGGSAGGGTITLPSALVPSYSEQLNNGSSGLSVPSPHLDWIGKVAFDPKVADRPLHIELAALWRRFEFYNPLSSQSFQASGGGGSANVNLELFKNFRLIANTFYSDGGGRYIFGQGPDLIIRGDGSPSLIHAYSTVDGIEYQATPKTLFFAFYGGTYFHKNVAIDPATGEPVGYGYEGSSSGHNRAIQEATAGFARTFWRNPNYGALQFMTQFSYVFRHPWYVTPGQPGEANLNMIYLNLRYTLPGGPPAER
jgi:hypothetical protein